MNNELKQTCRASQVEKQEVIKKEQHCGNVENKKVSPLKAIKLKCKVDCCNNDRKSWTDCEITDCWLYPFRFGKNPFSKRKGNADKLKAYRNKLNGGLG
jgi:hypothetical protein